jgi:hypothetical protein
MRNTKKILLGGNTKNTKKKGRWNGAREKRVQEKNG